MVLAPKVLLQMLATELIICACLASFYLGKLIAVPTEQGKLS